MIKRFTHWGRVTHICVGKQTIIGSDNGLSPDRRQAIIWINAGILLIGPLATKFNEILIEIHIFLFKEMHLKMSSGKWRPFCLGLNVLRDICNGCIWYCNHCLSPIIFLRWPEAIMRWSVFTGIRIPIEWSVFRTYAMPLLRRVRWAWLNTYVRKSPYECAFHVGGVEWCLRVSFRSREWRRNIHID